ncbi:MAG: SUMF1/EgtB/PvdO family nonheme iron enzyme [Xanthomonadales bacterium]|nr:SUMF1/EgtB/PvdO family nonheme iron enzyme [Xanthomonadales bacterium]
MALASETSPIAGLPEIDGYRVIRPLGRGGMATVYLAQQLSLDREVAIKVLSGLSSQDEELALRFEHEARIIARLEHPSIVSVHHVGRTASGQPFYVMPWLSRGDLSQRNLQHNEQEIADVLRALLDALGYAHARGVVHRDVKPENVLFDASGRPQLADFGIALARRQVSDRITGNGLALGSGGYMSPEQARAQEVDGRADLYSVGVLTYELLTGELPFRATDPLSLALKHSQQAVPRLPESLHHWQGFIDRAMAKNRRQRFRNAETMRRALDAVLNRTLPLPLQTVDTLRSLTREAVRSPWWLFATGLILAIVVVWGYVHWWRPAQSLEADAVSDSPSAPSMAAVAAIAARLQEAREQLGRGAIVTPAGENAAESYLDVLKAEPDNTDAMQGLDAVFAALAESIIVALADGRDIEVRQLFSQAEMLANEGGLGKFSGWAQLQESVSGVLGRRLRDAVARLDRATALDQVQMLRMLNLQTADLETLRQTAEALPQAGQQLQDSAGPPLIFLPARLGGSQLDRPMAMMQREVTVAEFARFIQDSRHRMADCTRRDTRLPSVAGHRYWHKPGFPQGDNEPVVCVSASDADAFADWLSQRTGARYRVPSLAEWRHASQIPAVVECGSGNLHDRRGCDDGVGFTSVAGRFAADALGFVDVVGNTSEWTASCDAIGCGKRLVAGSSWRTERESAQSMTVSPAQMLAADVGYDDVGLRLLREVDASSLPALQTRRANQP